ncbi:MAG: transglutaminase-like domain-containing protein [Candidatus Bathyarchaeia archaeon]|nr:transglutaminase-like domain-containing protein [Candidatus Bathyarchaeia archaeon]
MKELTKGTENDREAAVRIFYFARDQIRFAYPSLGKASDTLRLGYGTCSSKANVQVVLLRSIGIPARFRLQLTEARLLFGDKVPPPFIDEEFSGEVTHYLAEVYVDGKWLMADTTFDKELDPKRARDWNGKEHVAILDEKEVFRELGTKVNIDQVLESREKEWEKMTKQDKENVRLRNGILNSYFELVRLGNKLKPGKP